MKLQTQFTVPKKDLKDLAYVKKVDFSEEILIEKIYLLKSYPNFLKLLAIGSCYKI